MLGIVVDQRDVGCALLVQFLFKSKRLLTEQSEVGAHRLGAMGAKAWVVGGDETRGVSRERLQPANVVEEQQVRRLHLCDRGGGCWKVSLLACG